MIQSIEKTVFILIILCSPFVVISVENISSPWRWQCVDSVCVKQARSFQGDQPQLNLLACKLTCGDAGILWPKPTNVSIDSNLVRFLPTNIAKTVKSPNKIIPLLEEALFIFQTNLHKYHPMYTKGGPLWQAQYEHPILSHSLVINIVVKNDEEYLTLVTDESYSLSLDTNDSISIATITATTFFGARHALETLSQLTDFDEDFHCLQLVQSARIADAPVFPYRGLMVDTSSNFITVAALRRTMDAMAANKFNTLHWHITDSQSFPLYLESLSNMTLYGAYSSRQIYSPQDVKSLLEYGRVRGLRVLPEFDAPAHVGNGWQWAEQTAQLGKLVVCANQEPWHQYCAEPPCGQLNLANENMYEVLEKIYKEFVRLFAPIDLFHFGGDEVNLNCWNSSKEIVQWMNKNHFGNDVKAYTNQWAVFQERARQLLKKAMNNVDVPGVLWTSDLTEITNVDQYLNKSNYIIQIWTSGSDPLIGKLLSKGYRLIFSNYDAWYLTCGFGSWVHKGDNWCSPYKGWQTAYDNDPLEISRMLTGKTNPDLILGGEAALWTEQADDAALDSRLWPRSCAVAERLWSNPRTKWHEAQQRITHQRHRLIARGISADRLQPEWCYQNQGHCDDTQSPPVISGTSITTINIAKILGSIIFIIVVS